MSEDQAGSIEPRPTENNDFRRPPLQVVQQERPGAERGSILTRQRRICSEEDPGVVRVNRAPHFHHDHVAALRLVGAVEARGLVVRFVQTGVVLVLPPAVGALEGFELQPPLAFVPVCADLPAVSGAVHESPLEQRHLAGRHDSAQIAFGPAQDVPRQRGGLAHGQVAR